MSKLGLESGDRGEVSEYHLSWNNFNASLVTFVKDISPHQDLNSDSLSDVTISCAGIKTYKAHKLVLVTCSSYFRHLFLNKVMVGDEVSRPIVFIPDLSEEVLELILGFMYKGEITVPSNLILPLMEAAKLLGVQGLTEPGDSSSNSSSQSLVSPETQTASLVNDTDLKLDSDPENISQADSEEIDLKPSKVDLASAASHPAAPASQAADNGNSQKQIAFADSTKSLYSRSSFPTLTPLPNPVSLSLPDMRPLPHLLESLPSFASRAEPAHLPRLFEASPAGVGGFPTFGTRRRKSSPSRNSRSPRLISSSSSPNGNFKHFINKRSYSSSGHYPKTEDPSRPFACPICPKRFRMKHHLKEHNLIHSGEMPFSCHLCPKRFNRSYTLKNHMKLHSADNQERPQDVSLGQSLMIPLLSQPPPFP